MVLDLFSKDAVGFLKAAKKSPISLICLIILIASGCYVVFNSVNDPQIKNKDLTIQILEKDIETCQTELSTADVSNAAANNPPIKNQNTVGSSASAKGDFS
jgi:hypothetical protein